MSIVEFFRILNRNINIFLLCSLALAVMVFFVTKGMPETYQTRTEIYTGLISGAKVGSGDRLDYLTVSNQFDNLIAVVKSEQTLGEVGEKLLAQHMALEESEKRILGEEAWQKFQERVPQSFKDSVYVPDSELQTIKNIENYKEKYYDTWLVENLFIQSGSPYSPDGIGDNLSIGRIGGSDLVQITYTWTDPGICQNTVEILNKVFTEKLIEIKLGQSKDVVKYFKQQVDEARMRLMAAEDSLAIFRIKNKIINYDQQTQNIASLQTSLEKEYQDELRVRAAAKASVDQLADKLKLNKKIIDFSDELLVKKQRLADLNSEIAALEIYSNNSDRIQRLKTEATKLEAELSNNLSKRYQYSKTTEGVSNKEVLQEWLEATITLDASEARLKVLSNRSALFQNAYNEFSPLGAELKRLERAVDVAEGNYLELNTNLNDAITKQQGESLSTGGLVVTVPPRFPTAPIKTKQLLLVLVSAVLGFIFPFTLVLLIAFLDNTILTPIRAEEKTGLKLLGAYPDLHPGTEYKNVDMDWLTSKSVGHIVQNIRHESHQVFKNRREQSETQLVLVFSTRNQEGKSVIASEIINELQSLGGKIAWVTSKKIDNPMEGVEVFTYENDHEFLRIQDVDEIVPNKEIFDYIIFNIEPVLTEPYPIDLMGVFDLSVCVVSAKRSWNKADQFALNEFRRVLKNEPRLIVNGVAPDYMDSVLGEIKKSRSALRKLLKALITLQFKTKKFEA